MSFWWLLSGLLVFSCAGLSVRLYASGFFSVDAAVFTAILRAMPWLPPRMGATDALTVASSLQGALALGCLAHLLTRVRAEEKDGSLRLLLSGPVGRIVWLRVRVGHALGSAAVFLVASGLGFGLSSTATDGRWWVRLGEALGAYAAQVPVLLLFTGLVVLVFGALPHWFRPVLVSSLGSCLLFQIGSIWFRPSEPVLVTLALVGVAAATLGGSAFWRRDITS